MPTPYQPAGQDGYGFTDQQIESNRYRVTFTGNYETPLPTNFNALLYRAAEIAKSTGNDYFVDVSQHVEAQSQYQTTYFGEPGWGFGWHGWGGGGWGGGPWGGSAGISTADTRVRSRYTAIMDIQVFHGTKPADNPRAYSAQDVLERLGPVIQRPVTKS